MGFVFFAKISKKVEKIENFSILELKKGNVGEQTPKRKRNRIVSVMNTRHGRLLFFKRRVPHILG